MTTTAMMRMMIEVAVVGSEKDGIDKKPKKGKYETIGRLCPNPIQCPSIHHELPYPQVSERRI